MAVVRRCSAIMLLLFLLHVVEISPYPTLPLSRCPIRNYDNLMNSPSPNDRRASRGGGGNSRKAGKRTSYGDDKSLQRSKSLNLLMTQQTTSSDLLGVGE